jgi:low affinity Fe/Cu permease
MRAPGNCAYELRRRCLIRTTFSGVGGPPNIRAITPDGEAAAMTPAKSTSWFTRFAKATARQTGRPGTFVLALLVIVVWAVTGPVFRWSDTWQLIVNTGTTIITFLMVFLIQSTQNRDAVAVQVKLDELLRISAGHNVLMALEDLEEDQLERIRAVYTRLAADARHGIKSGLSDQGVPEIVELAGRTTPARESSES